MQASAARPCGSRRVRGILTKPGFGLAWRPEQMRRATATFDAAISAAPWQISLALVQGFLGNARKGRKGAAAQTRPNDIARPNTALPGESESPKSTHMDHKKTRLETTTRKDRNRVR